MGVCIWVLVPEIGGFHALDLELQVIIANHMGAKNQIQFLCKSSVYSWPF